MKTNPRSSRIALIFACIYFIFSPLSRVPSVSAQTPTCPPVETIDPSNLPRWEVELRPKSAQTQVITPASQQIKKTLLQHLNALQATELQVARAATDSEQSTIAGALTSRFALHLVLPASDSPAAKLGSEFQPSRSRLSADEIQEVASAFQEQILVDAPQDFSIACGFQPARPGDAPDFLGTLICAQAVLKTETSHWKKTKTRVTVPRPLNIALNRMRRSIKRRTKSRVHCPSFDRGGKSRRFDEYRSRTRHDRKRVTVTQESKPNGDLNTPTLITFASGCEKNKDALLSKIQDTITQCQGELESLRTISDSKSPRDTQANHQREQQSAKDQLDRVEQALKLAQEESQLRKQLETASQDLMFPIPKQKNIIIQLDISPSIVQRNLVGYAVTNVSFLIRRLKPDQNFNLILNSWDVFTLADHQLLPATQTNKDQAIALLGQLAALREKFKISQDEAPNKVSKRWKKMLGSKAVTWPRYTTYMTSPEVPSDLKSDSPGDPSPAYFLANSTKADIVLSFTDGEYSGTPQSFSRKLREKGETYQVQLKPMLTYEESIRSWSYANFGYSLVDLIRRSQGDTLLNFKHNLSDFTEVENSFGLLDDLLVKKEALTQQLNPEIQRQSKSQRTNPSLNTQDDWLSGKPKATLDALATALRQELRRLESVIEESEKTPESPETRTLRTQMTGLETRIQALQTKQTQISQQPCPDSAPN